MPRDKQSLIKTDIPRSDFGDFLSQKGNKRIFFSGKFGIGKTFFLQRFFEMHKDKYDVYHLYPIRYQISSNENIVELLKYDILVELLNKDMSIFDNPKEATNNLSVAWGMDRRLISAGAVAVSSIPLPILGRSLSEIHETGVKIYEKLQECNATDENIIENFKKHIDEKHLVETDYISSLISRKIEEVKKIKEEKDKNKIKSVLILDDFDRIDPEHIFRIFNVFSVHMDSASPNKFGFDHVIIVGDIDNIRSIFHHKYGADTDFNGYFDKFFTIKPYVFTNNKAVAEVIPSILDHLQFTDDVGGRLKEQFSMGMAKAMLVEMLGEALELKSINLRQLFRLRNNFSVKRSGVYLTGESSLSYIFHENYDIDVGIRILIDLYEGKQKLIDILMKIREKYSNYDPFYQRKNMMLYDRLAYEMLKKIISNRIIGDPKGPKLTKGEIESLDYGNSISILWLDKYTVEICTEPVTLRLIEGREDFFFYDTLLEYVKREEYMKTMGPMSLD